MQKNKTHLLRLKKAKKAQKPAFLRRNFMKNKRTRVGESWRAPKGLHNKLRRRRRGIGQWVMPGYRMPRAVRGLTVTGLKPTLVENLQHVEQLDPSAALLVIKKGVGTKNRIAILHYAQQKKIMVQNIKDPAAHIAALEKERAEKKKAKKVTVSEKKEPSKKEEKKQTPETKDTEEQKEEEKKEMQKVLTKKE